MVARCGLCFHHIEDIVLKNLFRKDFQPQLSSKYYNLQKHDWKRKFIVISRKKFQQVPS